MKRLALVSIPVFLLCGCTPKATSPAPSPPTPTPPRLFVAKDVNPTATPPRKAVLSLDGYKVPVQVEAKTKGEDFTINLYSHDELFDFEKYVVTDDSFALAEGALETYEPAIPLLVFPFQFQEPNREWQGKLSSEAEPHPAHATIEVSQDDLSWKGASTQTFRVTVVIFLDDVQNPTTAKRTLQFWFAPDHGLLQRHFDNASIREPVSE